MSVRIEMPWPPAELNPNRKNGRHWGATHKAKTKFHSDCSVLATQALRGFAAPAEGTIALRLTFVQPDKRRRDRDNLLAACKAMLDAVALAMKVDDSRFEPLTLAREFGKKPGSVIVEVLA